MLSSHYCGFAYLTTPKTKDKPDPTTVSGGWLMGRGAGGGRGCRGSGGRGLGAGRGVVPTTQHTSRTLYLGGNAHERIKVNCVL